MKVIPTFVAGFGQGAYRHYLKDACPTLAAFTRILVLKAKPQYMAAFPYLFRKSVTVTTNMRRAMPA